MSAQVVTADRWDLSHQGAFERQWEDVFRFALAWTNDWAAAEDLAQDAYLRLWQQRVWQSFQDADSAGDRPDRGRHRGDPAHATAHELNAPESVRW